MMRHQAMKASLVNYFRPSQRTIISGLTLFVIPYALTYYAIRKSRDNLETKYRNGEVAYRDRNFKFV